MKVWAPALLTFLYISVVSGPATSLAQETEGDLESEVSQLETLDKPAAVSGKSKSIDKINAAQAHLDKDEYQEAIDLLAPKRMELSRRGLMILARAYGKANDVQNEVKTLQLCVAQNPNDYIALTAYSDALYKTKRYDDAITHYRKSIEVNPRYQPSYHGLFDALETIKDFYTARTLLDDMIKRFGEKPAYVSHQCRLYKLDAFLDKAVDSCEKAISLDGKNPLDYLHLGLSLMDLEKPKEAEQILVRAAKKFPKSDAIQVAMAKVYVDKSHFVQAFRHYQMATKANPNSGVAWAGLASTAFQLTKNQEALDAYIKACKLDRTSGYDFRVAVGKLRERGDTAWRLKFESGVAQCR